MRLVDKLIGHFVVPQCVNSTFLHNHAKCMSPLVKAHRQQEGLTDFELFVSGKELCNAYTELNDPFYQRFDKAGRPAARRTARTTIFSTAFEYGLPATAGIGIVLLSGKDTIRADTMKTAKLFTLHWRTTIKC
jgi:lysyl-tRNA synthetase class 2